MQSADIPTGTRNPRGHTAAEVLAAITGRAYYTVYDPLEEEDGMTLVIPDQGEGILLELITSVDYYYRLFTNDVDDGLSTAEIEALTEEDFDEATFSGYEARLVEGGSWTVTTGDPSTATADAEVFTSSADQEGELVYGYYVTRASTGALVWYEYLDSPVDMDGVDETITIAPQFTLGDATEPS